jgi:hypothetical protein
MYKSIQKKIAKNLLAAGVIIACLTAITTAFIELGRIDKEVLPDSQLLSQPDILTFTRRIIKIVQIKLSSNLKIQFGLILTMVNLFKLKFIMKTKRYC